MLPTYASLNKASGLAVGAGHRSSGERKTEFTAGVADMAAVPEDGATGRTSVELLMPRIDVRMDPVTDAGFHVDSA